jgi:hypothetical protein
VNLTEAFSAPISSPSLYFFVTKTKKRESYFWFLFVFLRFLSEQQHR